MPNPHLKSRASSYSARKTDIHPIRKRILIVCEGEKTERYYFECFRVSSVDLKVIGAGMCTISLVNATIDLMKKTKYDAVWCVFDKDDCPIDQFENAIFRAVANNIKVAYSNQSFELWYVLHFEYLQSSIDRRDYCKKLSEHLKVPYKKNSRDIYIRLKSRQEEAIKNADKLLRNSDKNQPGRKDPSTTVHLLVSALNEMAETFYEK